MANVQTFKYAFKGMRKPDSFVVYPRKDKPYWLVQGHRAIALVRDDGTGIVNWRGSNSKYSMHLAKAMGGEQTVFDPEFVELVKAYQTYVGDTMANGVVTLA